MPEKFLISDIWAEKNPQKPVNVVEAKLKSQMNNLNVKVVGGYVKAPTQWWLFFLLLNKVKETSQDWKCFRLKLSEALL